MANEFENMSSANFVQDKFWKTYFLKTKRISKRTDVSLLETYSRV